MTDQPTTRRAEPVISDLYSEYKNCDRWAVIVGISKYQNSNLNLRYADQDAEDLYQLLLTPKGGGFQSDHICKLTNEQATTSNITRALRSFLKKPAREDLVLIYFACHGSPDPDRPSNIYLLTYDTDPSDIAGTALPMEDIDRALKGILHSDKVIILADTCHSAAIAGGIGGRRSVVDDSKIMNRFLQEISRSKGGVALLTSAEANEVSFEDAKWGGGHGVFTHYLLEGMRGAADRDGDGFVTIGELFEYVRDNVKKATDYRQHPSIGTNAYDRNLPIAVAPNSHISSPSEPFEKSKGKTKPGLLLTSFEFQIPSANIESRTVEKPGLFGKRTETTSTCNISYQRGQADSFVEDLGEGVTLEMVSIVGGKFTMGSNKAPEEKMPHQVTVQPFFMGKYAVTQTQWKAIVACLKINQDLNSDPSHFKDNDRPVERVSWHEAVEFCNRLSRKTGKKYRLPSEAEWEYACRAGTTTSFYCGEIITTDLAKYNSRTPGSLDPEALGLVGPDVTWREQTTVVGCFPPNAFGLYDMHGNIWEWCADHWHKDYEGAPTNGSAWVTDRENASRVWRGGSWHNPSDSCRSTRRSLGKPYDRHPYLGFRVVCNLV